MSFHTGNGRVTDAGVRTSWLTSYLRPKCVPFDALYPASTATACPRSRSIVKFQLCRYGDGGFGSKPFDVLMPDVLAREVGKGFAMVNRLGLVVDPVNDCEIANGNPPVRSV